MFHREHILTSSFLFWSFFSTFYEFPGLVWYLYYPGMKFGVTSLQDNFKWQHKADLKLSKVAYSNRAPLCYVLILNTHGTSQRYNVNITLTLTHDIVDYQFQYSPNNEHHWYNKKHRSFPFHWATNTCGDSRCALVHECKENLNIKRLVQQQPTSNGTLYRTHPWYCHSEADPDHRLT